MKPSDSDPLNLFDAGIPWDSPDNSSEVWNRMGSTSEMAKESHIGLLSLH